MPGRNESWQRTILSWNTSLNNLPAFLLKNGVVKAPRFYVVGWFPADIYKQNGGHSSGNPHALNDVTKFKSSPNVIPFVALVTKMRNLAELLRAGGPEANNLTLKIGQGQKPWLKKIITSMYILVSCQKFSASFIFEYNYQLMLWTGPSVLGCPETLNKLTVTSIEYDSTKYLVMKCFRVKYFKGERWLSKLE